MVEVAIGAAVTLADRGGNGFLKEVMRTAHADALHQGGRVDAAADRFAEAEALQAERQPQFPRLNSLRGFQYCDLLLGRGEVDVARERAA